MKELSIEEKAKRYNDLLAKLQEAKIDNNVCDERYCCVIDDIVPELKESEDERIRKALIRFHKSTIDIDGIKGKDILAWLEEQNNIDKASYDIAEKEKREFVGDGFIKCYADFQDFKEGETYWLEYLGNDDYNVRSDNLLGKTYHITPCQLYTIFKKQTWLEKQGEKKTIWHNEDEEPQKGSLILLIMQSGNPIVAKIIEPNHTFNHGERWAYIDDLLEKQVESPVDKVEPKFKDGDCI